MLGLSTIDFAHISRKNKMDEQRATPSHGKQKENGKKKREKTVNTFLSAFKDKNTSVMSVQDLSGATGFHSTTIFSVGRELELAGKLKRGHVIVGAGSGGRVTIFELKGGILNTKDIKPKLKQPKQVKMLCAEGVDNIYKKERLVLNKKENPVRTQKAPHPETLEYIFNIIRRAKAIRNCELMRLSKYSESTVTWCVRWLKKTDMITSEITSYKGNRSAVYTVIS